MIVIAGIATAFNFIIILWKFSNKRELDAFVDLSIFAAIAFLFAGTISGLQIGMIASMIISIYLLMYPPKIPEEFK